MTKNFKLVLALVLSVMMLMSGFAFAADATEPYVDNTHIITIYNRNENGAHEYTAYQIFKGSLDAKEDVLSNIEWGDGIDSDKLLAALVTANTSNDTLKGLFDSIVATGENKSTAKDVAEIIGKTNKTGDVAFTDAQMKEFARVIGNADPAILTTSTLVSVRDADVHKYTISNVPNDGYYFIKDTTASLPAGDDQTSFILQVVEDVTINAKADGLHPDKEIITDANDTAETDPAAAVNKINTVEKVNNAAIGDTVKYVVRVNVPDTTEYNKYKFNMYDTMEAGLTFTGVEAIYIADKNTADFTSADNYYIKLTEGSDKNYYVNTKVGEGSYAAFSAPTDPVTAIGGQNIQIVFNEFKTIAETVYGTGEDAHNLIGKEIIVIYKAVINDDATFGIDSNDNDVYFKHSNNPNKDGDGENDIEKSTDPKGETPHSWVKTFVTTFELEKIDGDTNAKLANAEFKIEGIALNTVIEKGERYEKSGYTAKVHNSPEGQNLDIVSETVGTDTYYKLRDGSYTTTSPTSTHTDSDGNTVTINTTQYENTDETWVKVSYEKVVKATTEGTKVSITGITDSTGKLVLKGLKEGTYTLTELRAPDGYNLLTDPVTIDVVWTKDGLVVETCAYGASQVQSTKGGFSIKDGQASYVTLSDNGDVYSTTVKNYSGATLPETGGIGTTIFYVAGSLMVLAAAILLITKRRMGAND